MKEIFDSQYLNKKAEPLVTRETAFKNYEPISGDSDLIEHSYEDNGGIIEFEKGETKISFQYSKEKENVGVMNRLSIQNKESHFDTDEIFVDGKWKLLFATDKRKEEESSLIDLDRQRIFITEDPMTVSGLISFLHEVGHYADYKTNKENYLKAHNSFRKFVFDFINNPDEEDGERVLKKERDAWAFALKTGKPFFKDLNINPDGLNWEIHSSCLRSYSNYLRKKLDKK